MRQTPEGVRAVMKSIPFSLVAFFFIASSQAANAACPTFHTLTNGTTANATDVMDNFSNIIECPKFNGRVDISKNNSAINTTPSTASLAIDNPTGLQTLVDFTFGGVVGSVIRADYAGNIILSAASAIYVGDPDVSSTPSPISLQSGALYINTSHNVGIGTVSPGTRLDVEGIGAAPATSGTSSTAISRVRATNTNVVLDSGTLAASPWTFWQQVSDSSHLNSTYPLALNPNGGNVGIGTTAPTQALEVNGQIKVDSLASASGTALCINANVISSCSSSRRYKEQIHGASFGLKEIEAMRPVTFKWKGRDEQDFGFIAEEIAKIDPRYVTYKAGKIEGVKYPQLTAILVNAVKQLKAANDRQAIEITQLRAQNVAAVGQLQDVSSRLAALERRIPVRAAENVAVAHHSTTK